MLYEVITANDQFWIRGENSIQVFQPVSKKLETVIKQPSLTAIDVWKNQLVIGTSDGYFTLDTKTRQPGETKKDLPSYNFV